MNDDLISRQAADKVIEHWQNIVNGIVPFGYTVEEE